MIQHPVDEEGGSPAAKRIFDDIATDCFLGGNRRSIQWLIDHHLIRIARMKPIAKDGERYIEIPEYVVPYDVHEQWREFLKQERGGGEPEPEMSGEM